MQHDYANIREMLGGMIGRKVIDITQHDEDEWKAGSEAYVMVMFDDGSWLKFPVTDLGFEWADASEAAA